jgi:hypothetical protein
MEQEVNNELIVKDISPKAVVSKAKDMAKFLQEIIANKKKPVIIGGEQYLEFEDWQLLGRFNGLTAGVVSTKEIRQGDMIIGYEAVANVVTKEGREITRAESMCLSNEKNWVGRDLFAIRSMAQTRACAKALRNVLSYIPVMAGYKSSVAEEM